jgi:acetyltransferase-like isoleucine patch superfamily enzyme
MSSPVQELDSRHFIRAQLHDGSTSNFRRYQTLVVGPGSIFRLLRYELTTGLLGGLPGALGLLLRKLFYPGLFRRCGPGVVFGRHLVLRNAQNIELDRGVVLDDYCLLDGRGATDMPVRIGERTILNRGVSVQAKVGSIRLGRECDIGAGSCIVSQGGIEIGDRVSLGGHAAIGGGLFATELPASAGTSSLRKISRGPIRIGDGTIAGMNVTVLDGVTIGRDCVLGASAIVRESIPEATIATPHQRLVLLPREPAPVSTPSVTASLPAS